MLPDSRRPAETGRRDGGGGPDRRDERDRRNEGRDDRDARAPVERREGKGRAEPGDEKALVTSEESEMVVEEEDDGVDEAAMAAMLGFGGFGSTKVRSRCALARELTRTRSKRRCRLI